MMLHPEITRQLAADRRREMIDRASRHRQARTAQAARSASAADQARPQLLRRVHAVLTSH